MTDDSHRLHEDPIATTTSARDGNCIVADASGSGSGSGSGSSSSSGSPGHGRILVQRQRHSASRRRSESRSPVRNRMESPDRSRSPKAEPRRAASSAVSAGAGLGWAELLSKSSSWFGGASSSAVSASASMDEGSDLDEFGSQAELGKDDSMLAFPLQERKRVRAKRAQEAADNRAVDNSDSDSDAPRRVFGIAASGDGASNSSSGSSSKGVSASTVSRFNAKQAPSKGRSAAAAAVAAAVCGSSSSKDADNELMEEYKLDSNIKLSEDQQRGVHRAIRERKSVFFTGPGGNGKSQALREIIRLCLVFKIKVAVCGATGVAAINLGKLGTTLHAWMGLGLAQGPWKKLLQTLKGKPLAVLQRWKLTQILIIDEISILDPGIFEKLDLLARAIRGNDLPFGGMTMVICGDFLQLPPVERSTDANFCFQTRAWSTANIQPILLDKPFRHPDPVFAALLGRMRKAEMLASDWDVLATCLRDPDINYEQIARNRLQAAWSALEKLKNPFTKVEDKFVLAPLSLTCRKVDVSKANEAELEMLQPNKKMWVRFTAEKGMEGADNLCRANLENWLANMEKNCPARPDVQMCTGAQVMMCANVDTKLGLVNGQRGIIVGWSTAEKHSRSNRMERYPIVRFSNGRVSVVKRYQWAHESFSYDGTAYYEQVPLMLGWHFTIHKSQSLTVSEVDVDLSTVFAEGQAYVACSRVRTLEGLKLNGLKKSIIKAHPDALAFYKELEAAVAAERLKWAREAATAVGAAGAASGSGSGSGDDMSLGGTPASVRAAAALSASEHVKPVLQHQGKPAAAADDDDNDESM